MIGKLLCFFGLHRYECRDGLNMLLCVCQRKGCHHHKIKSKYCNPCLDKWK